MKKNPFEILGLRSNATKEDIVKKYKTLAREYHPDKNVELSIDEQKEKEEKFKELSCAFSFLQNHNFKYSGTTDDFKDYTFKFNFFSKGFSMSGNKISNLFEKIKNIDLDNIADNIWKEVNTIQDLYNQDNEQLEKSIDININVNVDILDIYNNVKQKFEIKCIKKCKVCLGLGYDLNTKNKCIDCNGLKIKPESIQLSFNSSIKNKKLKAMGNEEIGKRPGDININVFPKQSNLKFRIIDHYNLFYTLILDLDNPDIKLIINNNEINNNEINNNIEIILKYKLMYLDLQEKYIEIKNPNIETVYEYTIENHGLLKPNTENNRGNLIIQLIDTKNTFEKHINKYSIDKYKKNESIKLYSIE